MIRRLRDYWSGLHAGGAGADQPDALAGEIHALMRPGAGVEPLAFEVIPPTKIRHVRRRKAADRSDQELRRVGVTRLGPHPPHPCSIIPLRTVNPVLN